ncbi:MAG: ABC transporter permease [Dysgonomonas sp.]
MNNALGLIIQREFFSRVKTKAFILTTILTPFLLLAVTFLPTALAMLNKNDDITKVYVLDHTGTYAPLFKSSDKYEFVNLKSKEEKQNGDKTAALLEITANLNNNPKAVTFYSEKQQPPSGLISYIDGVLTEAVRNKKIDDFTTKSNIEPQVVTDLQQLLKSKDRINVNTVRLDETGKESETLGLAASIVSMVLTFCMFFFIMMYGQLVVQSVVEEKTNRIIEVIISSVRPFDLMMGKIVGVGLVGLLQLIVWVVIGGGAIVFGQLYFGNPMSGMETQQAMAMMQNQPEMMDGVKSMLFNINWIQIGACMLLYFVGGYLLFASLYAMFGSAANDSQEAQQLMMPLTIVLMLAFYTGFAAANNPEGQMAFWCSLVPFTSPVVMMVRAPYEIPIWELLLSVVLLFVTAILMIKFAAKIYRVGILMYGKKVTFSEMMKWLKYK